MPDAAAAVLRVRLASRVLVVSCVIIVFFAWFGVPSARAGPGDLTEEWLREWCDACGIGIGFAEVRDIAIGDVNGDGVPEIVAVGIDVFEWQLTVYRWHDGNGDGAPELTLIQRDRFGPSGNLPGLAVAIGNFGGGGAQVAVVWAKELSVDYWELEIDIWQWGGSSLIPVATAHTTYQQGQRITPEDAVPTPPDGTGRQDLIVAYHYFELGLVRSRLGRWTWQSLPAYPAYQTNPWNGEVRGVALGDTDGDGVSNLVTAGRVGTSPPYQGDLRLWRLDPTAFTQLGPPVQRPGGTVTGYSFEGVIIDGLDIGRRVLAAGGADFGESGEYGEMTRWVHQTTPSDLLVIESTSGNVPLRYYEDLGVGQLDQDARWEAVAVGAAPVSGGYSGFSIWQQDSGASMTLEVHHDLTPSSLLLTTVVGDPDLDGVKEFMTGGHHHPPGSLQPTFAQLAAWAWSSSPVPPEEWAMFHRFSTHDGNQPSPAPISGNLAWSRELQVGFEWSHTCYSPVVLGGRVFTVVEDLGIPYIYAYDIAGNFLWRTSAGTKVIYSSNACQLAVSDGKVFYTGTTYVDNVLTGLIGAVDATLGTRLWEVTLAYEDPREAPTVEAGRLWVASGTLPALGEEGARVYAYGLQGTRLLSFNVHPPGQPTHEGIVSSVAVWRDRAFVRSGTHVYAIPVSDPNGDGIISNPGEVLWRFDLAPWSGSGYEAPLAGSPTVADGVVLVGSHDGHLYALPASDPSPDGIISPSEVVWTSALLGDYVASTPAVSGGVVYVGANHQGNPNPAEKSHLYALSLASGATLWSKGYSGEVRSSSPAVADGKVFFVATGTSDPSDYHLIAYTTAGTFLWFRLVDEFGAAPGTSPAIAAGMVFVGNGVDNVGNYQPADRAFIYAFD